MTLPQNLYRGDQDPINKRDLRATLGSGLLLTNLCKGGIGREIFNQPLKISINAHVAIGWDKTHFLSFSESAETAIYYASNGKEYYETYEVKEPWDFTLLTFETSRLTENSFKQIDKGLYSAEFVPTCKEFLPSFKIFLIDVVTHLKNIDNLNFNLTNAISNAERDKEWLILPASPFGNGEFSGKLDTNCISDIQVFKLL